MTQREGRDLRVQENRIVVPPGGIERGEGKVRVRSRKSAPSTKIAMKPGGKGRAAKDSIRRRKEGFRTIWG